MRLGRSAKQRVWLGPDRYRGCCRDAVTNRDAESYANPNSYACCMRSGKSNTYAYCHSFCYTNSYAKADSHTEVSANTEESAHAAAETLILSDQ